MNQITKYLFILFLLYTGTVKASFVPDTFLISECDSLSFTYLNTATFYVSDTSATVNEFLQASNKFTVTDKGIQDKAHWVYLNIRNDKNSTQSLIVGPNSGFDVFELYRIENNQRSQTLYNGYLVPYSKRNLPKFYDYFKIDLEEGETVHLVLKGYNLTNTTGGITNYFIGSDFLYQGFVKRMEVDRMPFYGITIAFQGAIWIMFFFMFFLFVQNPKEKVYSYYTLYLGVVMLYMLLKLASAGPFFLVLLEHPFLRSALNEPLQFLISVAYNLFAIQFLNLKKNNPKVYKAINIANIFYLSYAIFIFSYFYLTKDAQLVKSFFIPTRIVMFIVGVTLIIWTAIKVESPVKKYFIWGSSFFFMGSILGIMYSISMYSSGTFLPWLPNLSIKPINLTQIGVVLEILLFSLGIGKLIHINNVEKEEIKDAYISQLEQNEELNKTHAKQLETKVKERTEEVLKKTTELATLQSQKQKIEFQRQLMNREMRVLRLQMNPHFIFNSLNSIRYFILKQNEEKAIEYIELFSKLLRMILDYSKRDLITLEEELSALELYIKFEKERFNQKFDYQIIVDPELSSKSVAIPPLLLQPFAENSIWHGLMHQDKKGCLTIKIQKTSNTQMTITVEDNGVGREKATEIANRNGKKHQSHGMEITKSRIEMINEAWNQKYGFVIQDLKSEDGKATGTRVVFTIKIQDYDRINN